MTTEPRVIASGLGFPEGPVYLGDGVVVVTEIRGGRLTRCTPGEKSVLSKTGSGPNGATLGVDDALWVALNGGLSLGPGGYWKADPFLGGGIERVMLDGRRETLPPLPGEPAHRPNDLCFGPDGKLYVTDPRNWEDLANLQMGRIWRLDASSGAADVVAEVPLFCNGIAFGPDDRLYVNQTMGMKVVAFDWSPDGLGDQTEFVTLTRGFPDGGCFAANGDFYACGATGDVIQVYGIDGAHKETIEFPEHSEPTNACIGDGSLYVTCSGSGELLAFDLGLEALPLHPFRS